MKKLLLLFIFLLFTFCISAQEVIEEEVIEQDVIEEVTEEDAIEEEVIEQEVIEVEEDNSDMFKNVKMLKSEQDEEVQIEIRRPDNASLMPRKITDFENTAELKMVEKLKKSNKLLY